MSKRSLDVGGGEGSASVIVGRSLARQKPGQVLLCNAQVRKHGIGTLTSGCQSAAVASDLLLLGLAVYELRYILLLASDQCYYCCLSKHVTRTKKIMSPTKCQSALDTYSFNLRLRTVPLFDRHRMSNARHVETGAVEHL